MSVNDVKFESNPVRIYTVCMCTYQYHKMWKWQMGSHPCLVLVEWGLLLIPLVWPMTERTESCLFSGSVAQERKRWREKQWLENVQSNSQTTQTNKQTKKKLQ